MDIRITTNYPDLRRVSTGLGLATPEEKKRQSRPLFGPEGEGVGFGVGGEKGFTLFRKKRNKLLVSRRKLRSGSYCLIWRRKRKVALRFLQRCNSDQKGTASRERGLALVQKQEKTKKKQKKNKKAGHHLRLEGKMDRTLFLKDMGTLYSETSGNLNKDWKLGRST